MFCEGVDLNSYLVRECGAMAIIARQMNKAADADYFEEAAEKKRVAVNKYLWSEQDGIYYDYHILKDEPIRQKYIGAFFPLWARAASKEQALRLVNHYSNEKEFNRPWGAPVISADSPYYTEGFYPGDNTRCCTWRAHIWAPANYLLLRGLVNYGYDREALLLVEKLDRLFCRGPFSEYYTAESGIGTGRKPFLGWTALIPFLAAELKLGLDPTDMASERNDFQRMREYIFLNFV